MCGIIAVIGEYRYPEIPKALIERGRDSQGVYEDDNVQLIQTRLEINKCDIELPYQTDRYVLLFNGEIYNWKELGGAHEFESIIKGFEKHDVNLHSKLDGQYFIFIYDKLTGEYYMFNDEFKINAAYVTYEKDSVIIASNIRSLPNIKFAQMNKKGYGNVSTAKLL